MIEIQLLGTPRIIRDGDDPPQPRGRKSWGLLAYLALSEIKRPSRQHLAELLFGDAADPLRSLRWNLSELRRALGKEVLPGGQAQLVIGPEMRIDVHEIATGTPQGALALPGLGRDLLEGMDFSASPVFDGWLAHERRRLVGAAASALHEAALDRLADRRPASAVPLATRLVELDPYDENFQELLIRAHAQAGDVDAANGALASCRALFSRELGREPAESLERASVEPTTAGDATPAPELSVRHTAGALIEAGEAAAGAGAVDAALQSLRRAVAIAASSSHRDLEARALFTLGSALVHSVRGRDEEGASLLRRAARLAESADSVDIEASAIRELGYIDALAGRYARCEAGLAKASAISRSGAEKAAVESIWAMAAADCGAHERAVAHASRAVDLAQQSGDQRRAAFALTFAGRSQALTGRRQSARSSLERALAIVGETDWLAFAAWPEAWLAEIELAEGDVAGARERMEYAFALACEFRDPCWEGMAGRGLGLISSREGDVPTALRRFEDARQRASRTTDCYVWGEAYALEALAGAAVDAGSPRAPALVEDLRALAGRTGMREMAAKAFIYRSRLGDPAAAETARLLSSEVENPALRAELEGTGVER